MILNYYAQPFNNNIEYTLIYHILSIETTKYKSIAIDLA